MGGQTLLTITIFSVDGKLSNVAATQEGPGNGSSYYQLISPKGENIIFKSTGLGNGGSATLTWVLPVFLSCFYLPTARRVISPVRWWESSAVTPS